MKSRSPTFKDLPLKIVGSTIFGRYPKISVEQTFNMIVSDDWLVPYAGYKYAITDSNGLPIPINGNGFGRGIYASTREDLLFVCVYNGIYLINTALVVTLIGTIATFVGDVFFAEDNQGNLAICDKEQIYFYNPTISPTLTKATIQGGAPLDFIPGYIAFQDTRFIAPALNSAPNDVATSTWRLSEPSTKFGGHPNQVFPSFSVAPFPKQYQGQFQSKADLPLVTIPFPGRGQLLLVMGSVVGQLWTDIGFTTFPYVLNQGVNIDYGCLNADTVANLDNIVSWLGFNDRSGPVILVSNGGVPERISTDGIDFKLASLTTPEDSHGFMFKQDGHIFYQLTFPTDNFSVTYDFTTQKFFTITDTYMNYHPAKRVAFFNNTYYFVSLNDGNLFEMSTSDTTYIGDVIPRVRVLPTVRMPDTAPFVANNLTFPMEQGVDGSLFNPAAYPILGIATEDYNYITTENGRDIVDETINSTVMADNPPLPRVDLSVSYDGGYSFSSYDPMTLNPIGDRRNRFIYYSLGWGNEFTPQFRLWSFGRFVLGDGTVSIYQ